MTGFAAFSSSTAHADVLETPFSPGSALPVSLVEPETGSQLGSLLTSAEKGLDFAAVTGAVYVAHALYRVSGAGKQLHYAPSTILLVAAGFAALFVILLERYGGYRAYVSLLGIRETERVLRVTLQSFLLALLAVYCCAASVSRLAFLFALVTVPVFLTLEKWEMQHLVRALRSRGHGTRKAVIFGTGEAGRRVYSALARSPKFGIVPIAFVDDGSQSSSSEIYESSYRRNRPAKVVAGPLSPELFRQIGASVLVIATREMEREAIQQTATRLSQLGVNTYFMPEDSLVPGYWVDYEELDGIMLAHLSKGRIRLFYDLGKRLLDVVLSASLLLISAPLTIFIAALVNWTSPGTVLFRQMRVGQSGRLFTMYKFRTMYWDVPAYGYSPKAGADPRITPLGRLLRSTSLDELPQLINVLLGQMSLVGPRPEMPFIVDQYTAAQRQRLSVKPGITGLWQLSADRAFLIHENIEYDLYYVRHRSLLMDAAILLHTFLFAARGV